MQDEKASADKEAITSYPEDLAKKINENSYSKQQMFSVNESALYWKKISSRTFTAREKKLL